MLSALVSSVVPMHVSKHEHLQYGIQVAVYIHLTYFRRQGLRLDVNEGI